MIGEVAGKGEHFYECLRYIAKPVKCEWTEYRNLNMDDPTMAANEMMMAAEQRRANAKDPLYHYVISWAKSDIPTKEQMLEVADRWLEHMKLDEHQVLIGSHKDMPYSHIHLAINRVHSENYKSWNRRKDWERSEVLLKELEQEYGWEIAEGKHHPQLGVEIDGRAPKAWEIHQEKRQKKIAAGMGVDPASVDGRNIIDKCEEINKELWEVVNKGKEGSFKEFDQVLDQQGLWLDMARNKKGMVIFDGKYHVKASDVSRHFSGPTLEGIFDETLKGYVKDRNQLMRHQEGISLATDWKQALDDKERRAVQQLLVSKVPIMEERYKELKELSKAFNEGIGELEKEITEEIMYAYEHDDQALERIQTFLNKANPEDQSQRIQEALYENPGQFGKIRDEYSVQLLAESFGKVDKLEGEYGHYFEGRTREERKAEMEDMEQSLSEKKAHIRTLKSKLSGKARREIAEGSEVGEAVVDSYNTSLSLYRGTNMIYNYFIKDRPVGRNKALDTQMASALKEINEGFNQAFDNPIKAKQFFGEIAWNDYRNEAKGINLVEDIIGDPGKFGKVKDNLDLQILQELLRKPQQIREQHKDFLATLGAKGQIEYFRRLPDVYGRDQSMVGGLSIVGELNRWVGRAAGATPAGKAIFKTGSIGIKLAKSLAHMLEGPSKGARKSVRAVIKDSVSISQVSTLEQGKERAQGIDQGDSGLGL